MTKINVILLVISMSVLNFAIPRTFSNTYEIVRMDGEIGDSFNMNQLNSNSNNLLFISSNYMFSSENVAMESIGMSQNTIFVGAAIDGKSRKVIHSGVTFSGHLGCNWEKQVIHTCVNEGVNGGSIRLSKHVNVDTAIDFILVSKHIFQLVGGMDTSFRSIHDMIADFCIRASIQLNSSIVFHPSLIAETVARNQSCSNYLSQSFWMKWRDHLLFSVESKHAIGTNVLLSSLLAPRFSTSGFFAEGVQLASAIRDVAFLAIDENCVGWGQHHKVCSESWEGEPHEHVKRMIKLNSLNRCNSVGQPQAATIVIWHFPLDWIDRHRLPGYNVDSIGLPPRYISNGFHHHVMGTEQENSTSKAHRVYRIARSMYEASEIPAKWVDRLNTYDEIWVPAAHSRRIFALSGVNPLNIFIVPESVDSIDWGSEREHGMVGFEIGLESPFKFKSGHQVDSRQNGLVSVNININKTKSFVFLSVFKWEDRKGWDILLRAYFNEFSEADDVTLIIRGEYLERPEYGLQSKSTHEFLIDQLNRNAHAHSRVNISNSNSLPHVIILQDKLDVEEMRALFGISTVFVMPSRGEGWGLTFHQAMSMGKPCIATAWGGNMEFMNDRNSFLIWDFEMTKSSQLHGMWANPSVLELQSLMRFVYANPREVSKRGKQAAADVAQFNLDNLRHRIVERLKVIETKLYGNNRNN